MTPEEIKKNHFEHLKTYNQSAEYAEYARSIGRKVPEGELPSLLGKRWEIDRETYEYFLEILPPLGMKDGAFYMEEFTFGNITAKYSQEGDRYFCEFARGPVEEVAPSRYMSKWLAIGKKNPWIREAEDPPFNSQSFHQCRDDAELLDKFQHGAWCLGQAFHIGDLCFIQQVGGGDEYLAIKEGRAFESISFGRIIATKGRDAAQAVIDRIREATVERCVSLDY